MDLIRLIVRDYRWPFSAVMLASLANAGLGVGVIAFINQRLIAHQDAALSALPEFFGLIVALLIVALAAQLGLTTLGHHFVFDLRSRLIKRILDTDIGRLETIGSAALIASLSADIRNVTIAFVRLPELVQGLAWPARCIWAGCRRPRRACRRSLHRALVPAPAARRQRRRGPARHPAITRPAQARGHAHRAGRTPRYPAARRMGRRSGSDL